MRFSSLLPYITPHRSTLLAVVVLLIAGSLVSLANPWLAGLVTARLIGDAHAHLSTNALLVLWLVLMLARAGLDFFSQYHIGSTGERLTAQLRNRLYQHLQALPLGYYQQRRPGETLTLLSSDAEIISSFVTDTLVQLLPAMLTFCGAFIMMAWLDPVIALLALLLVPGYVVAVKLLGRQLRPLSRDWVEANSKMVSVVDENLIMLPAIKAFTREGHEQARFESSNQSLFSVSRRYMRVQSMLSPAIGLLGGAGLLLMLGFGTHQVTAGALAAPQLVSLLLYAALLVAPLRTLAGVYGQVQRTRGSAERILAFLGEREEPADQGIRTLSGIEGAIRFDDVHFTYAGRKPLFQGLSLDIAPGETVALTGPNGSGKTTLAYLLMRFTDPTAGAISIDGIDIREVTLASLRSQIGLVAQQVLLLNGTVAENIAYGRPDVGLAEIERAAVAAHAHDFISHLPDGYDTLIGDQGVRLSGGQRQRLSLARTLLKDPPILILDEATAMFDPAGEQAFIDECHAVLTQKTVILITHRPASLALADRVLQFPLQGCGASGLLLNRV